MSIPKGLLASLLDICDDPFATPYWNAGGRAALAHKSAADNPHAPDTYEHGEWVKGYEEVRADME
jgi:hypothetical protein